MIPAAFDYAAPASLAGLQDAFLQSLGKIEGHAVPDDAGVTSFQLPPVVKGKGQARDRLRTRFRAGTAKSR